MPAGIVVSSYTSTDTTPAPSVIPANLRRNPLPIVTPVIAAPTLTGGRAPAAYANSQVTYRDATAGWGSLRLVVGGKDVTFFRNAPSQIGGYQLQEPYGYGGADFAFPQITSLEVDQHGTGELRWFDLGKPARLVQVDKDNHAVRTVWRGFISTINPTKDGTAVHCDGAASGRLALRDRHPALFVFTKDIGTWLFDAFRLCGLPLSPSLGPKTGIKVDSRGRSGTYLSYTDGLLAEGMELDGDQWTIMPHPTHPGRWQMRLKDRTTVHATAFNGAHGVDPDVTRDLSEEPTTIYGTGRDPDGQLWVNGRYPNIVQGDPPPFPGTLQKGDTGTNVETLQNKLIGVGYLSRSDAIGSTFDDNMEDAVQALQDDAGLPSNGVVDQATWNAAYDLTVTKMSLRQAWQAPLAQASRVRKGNYTANGSLAGRNPNYDPQAIEVDLSVDHGAGTPKRRARQWSKRKLAQIQNGKNWAGTITLTADVAKGDATATGTITPMSRLDLEAGMNLRVRHFDGNTLFHISGISVSSTDSDTAPIEVRCAVDTKARDLLTLGQVIERNRASRINPARQWLRQHRGTDPNHAQVEWSEIGGEIFNKITCPALQWTVFPVVAGQAGTVNRIRIDVSDSPSAFVTAVFAKKVGPKYMHKHLGNPFDVQSPVTSLKVTNGGSGYTSAPTVTISGGDGSGATATATITGDKVTGLTLTSAGAGYNSAPDVSFSGGGGSGASAEATIRPGSYKWQSDKIRADIDDKRALLGAWGDESQPCGFAPGVKTDENGPTGDPVTGLLLDSGGFEYHTFDQPVVYVALFPKTDCHIAPQRIMWPVMEAGT